MFAFILGYLGIINWYSFLAVSYDKRAAIKKTNRIAENHLFLYTWLGGGIGFYLAMHYYHHKTNHLKFLIGVPLIILCQIMVTYLLIRYF